MTWYDISGPEYWTLSIYQDPGGDTVSTAWNGTNAQLNISGGDSSNLNKVRLVATPTPAVAALAVTEARVVIAATYVKLTHVEEPFPNNRVGVDTPFDQTTTFGSRFISSVGYQEEEIIYGQGGASLWDWSLPHAVNAFSSDSLLTTQDELHHSLEILAFEVNVPPVSKFWTGFNVSAERNL